MAARETLRGLAVRLFGVDLRALAALRIAMGVLLVVDLLLRSRDLAAFYSDGGVLPRAVMAPDPLRDLLSPHFWSGGVSFQGFLMALEGGLAVLLALGLFTRVATIGCWLLHASLQARNPFVADYGDTMVRMVLFWGMFLPLGARASLDARRHPGRGPAGPTVTSPASAALLVQAFLVYFFAGVYKWGPDWNEDGTALYYVFHQDWWLRPMGAWIAENLSSLLPTAARLVRWVEVLGPIALFSPIWTGPIRIIGTIASWLFQLGLGTSIVLQWMPFVSSSVMLPFLPVAFWDAVERRLRGSVREPAATHPAQAPQRPGLTLFRDVAVAGLLAFVVAWNVAGFRDDLELPAPAKRFGKLLHLNQEWAMYSPGGPRFDGWYVIRGEMADGTVRNLWRDRPLDGKKPERLSSTHPSTRWGLWEFAMARPTKPPPPRLAWGRWLCRSWNSAEGGVRVERLHVLFVMERTPPPGEEPTPRGLSLFELDCDRVEPHALRSDRSPERRLQASASGSQSRAAAL